MRGVGFFVFVFSYCVAEAVLLRWGWHLASLVCGTVLIVSAYSIARVLRAPVRGTLLVCVVGIAVAVIRMFFLTRDLPEAFSPLVDQKVSVTGVVVSLPDLRETSSRITVEIRSGLQSTRVLAAVPLYPVVRVGDNVELQGTLKRPQAFETDGGRLFEYADFLSKDGIFSVMQPASVHVTGISKDLWLEFLRMLEACKDYLMTLLSETLPEPESSLAAGLLVGGKQGLGEGLIDAFTKAGMLQIIVLSGYNVMIVAETLMRGLRRVPKKLAFMVGVFSIACFVLIAGAGSSALRAGLMAFIAITARTYKKRYDVQRAVWLSLFALALWNPLMLVYDPGFQFSFIATLGLIFGVPILAPRLLFIRSALWIELISTTLAAEIALLPFLLWETGNLSLVSVIANVISMPAVPFAMAASAGALVIAIPLSLIASPLVPVAGIAAYLPLAYIIKVATLSASLPFALVIISAFPFWVVLLAYAVLGALVYRDTRQPLRGSVARPLPS